MPDLSFATLDVFTSARLVAGNPLAVVEVSAAAQLSQERKQLIAREFNYSETVFLRERGDEDGVRVPVWTLDIFTPHSELPFAGHPTIGAACHALARLASQADAKDEVIHGTFVTKAGRIALEYSPSKQSAKASIPHNVHVHRGTLARSQLLEWQPALRAATQQNTARLPEHWPIVSIVNGMTFALVSLDSLEALSAVSTGAFQPAAALDAQWDESFLGLLFYVRLPHAANDGTRRFRTRMLEGPLEDPATGSASSALAAYLSLEFAQADETATATTIQYAFTQGVEMGRQSDIGVEVVLDNDRAIKTIQLVGGAVQVMRGAISA